MKYATVLVMALVMLAGSAFAAADVMYCVGISSGDKHIVHFSYRALGGDDDDGATIAKIKSGEMKQAEIDSEINQAEGFAKNLGHLSVAQEVKFGDVVVPQGEYQVGFHAAEGGKFSMLIWFGNEPKKVAFELMDHKGGPDHLAMMMVPAPSGHTLMGFYKHYIFNIPVSLGGEKKAEAAPAKSAGSESAKPAPAAKEKKADDWGSTGGGKDDDWKDDKADSFSGK